MSLNPRCYALSQISFLVANINKRNYKDNCTEIARVIKQEETHPTDYYTLQGAVTKNVACWSVCNWGHDFVFDQLIVPLWSGLIFKGSKVKLQLCVLDLLIFTVWWLFFDPLIGTLKRNLITWFKFSPGSRLQTFLHGDMRPSLVLPEGKAHHSQPFALRGKHLFYVQHGWSGLDVVLPHLHFVHSCT